jgi:chromatin assembly factor 1 subunit B
MSFPSIDETASTGVRFCPILFQRSADCTVPLVDLPYRMVFAVATLGAVALYDTEHMHAIAVIANLHYDKLTDVAWYVSCS